jgi:hypothetical protein
MFHTYVTSICIKCLICFRRMLHSSVSFASVSYFRGMFKESWGTARVSGKVAWRAEGHWMGRAARLGSCGRGMLVLNAAPGSCPCVERGGVRGRSGGRGAWRADGAGPTHGQSLGMIIAGIRSDELDYPRIESYSLRLQKNAIMVSVPIN